MRCAFCGGPCRSYDGGEANDYALCVMVCEVCDAWQDEETDVQEEVELCAALFEMHPRPWVVDDNRDGHVGLMSVFDANGRSIVCTCDMEACEGGDIELAYAIAALPDLIALAQAVGADYDDAADWKDARSSLTTMARSALVRLSR